MTNTLTNLTWRLQANKIQELTVVLCVVGTEIDLGTTQRSKVAGFRMWLL